MHQELFGQFDVPELGTYVVEEATVAPSGIAIKDGVAFNSAAFIHPPYHFAQVTQRLAGSSLPRRRIRGSLAVIYGPGHETYGHWLVDFLPRLWVLAQCGYDLATLRYVVPPELTMVARSLLSRLGIGRQQLVPYRYWREVIVADLLLLPTGLRAQNRVGGHFGEATAFWTSRLGVQEPEPGDNPTHLMVSRHHVQGARILNNRAQIEAIALARGYAIVHPQDMTLTRQAALFAGARVIVGEYGSALHGSVYAAAGTLTIGLRGTARHPSFVQSGIAAALRQHAGYVLGEMTLGAAEGEVGQVFAIRPEDFERALDIAAVVAK